MLTVDDYGNIRLAHRDGMSINEIARTFHHSRRKIRQILAHAQRLRSAPRALLASIPGLELLEPDEWELCCGSAGVYNVLYPAPAAELGRRKARNLLATGAQAIAAANPGCVMQIQAHLREAGHPLPVHHPIEILDASIRGASPA